LTSISEISWQQIAAVVIVGFLILLVQYDVIPVMQPSLNSFDMTWLDETKGIAIFIHVTVSAPQDFTATLPVTVSAYGSSSDQQLRWIWNICACFSDAYEVVEGQIIPNPNAEPFAGVHLNVTHTKPVEYTSAEDFAGEYLVGLSQSIEWQSPTQTIPYIMITYRNTTVIRGIGQNLMTNKPFPDKGFSIEPFSTLESNEANIKLHDTGLLIFAGTIVEAVLLFVGKRKHVPREEPIPTYLTR